MIWVIAVWLSLSALATAWCLSACIIAGRVGGCTRHARADRQQSSSRSMWRGTYPPMSSRPQLSLTHALTMPVAQQLRTKNGPT